MPSIKMAAIGMLKRKEKVYGTVILCGCIFSAIFMYARVFYGTEITDESYYISEALAMLNGNIPYAYNNSSMATGFTFLIIPIIFVYRLFNESMEGVFLATRICFVTFRFIILGVIFGLTRKRIGYRNAMLLTALFIPCNGSDVFNFSYNTIPFYMAMLSAFILYDAIEQKGRGYHLKLFVTGFSTAITCFAHPGYGLALLVFLGIILLRLQGRHNKWTAISLFIGGGLVEVLAVMIPIIIQTSFSALVYGIYRLFFEQYPVEPLNPNKNFSDTLLEFWEPTEKMVVIFIIVTAFTFLFAIRYVYEDGKPLGRKNCLIYAIACSMTVNLVVVILQYGGIECVPQMAYIGAVYFVFFSMIGMWKREKLTFYLGIYPILFSIVEIILVSRGGIGRFYYSFPVFMVIFCYLLNSEVEIIRMIATITIVMLAVAIGYGNYKSVYRDESIRSLDCQVESGVYKGIYTTDDRAQDLPELEKYLNSIVEEDESYAFRDNVPCAYLMMHTGHMCEPSTWDIMNYTYKRNAPSVVFDYYKRRDMIPDKIIYIDYGRDEFMSIEEDVFRYNDFVNANYSLVDDFKLSNTFTHIMVYENNDSFDGNYDYWIDKYYELIERK